MNFPTRHALNQGDRRAAVLSQADLVVGLDMTDFWGATHAYRDQLHRSSRSLVKLPEDGVADLGGSVHQIELPENFQRFTDVDFEISGTARRPCRS